MKINSQKSSESIVRRNKFNMERVHYNHSNQFEGKVFDLRSKLSTRKTPFDLRSKLSRRNQRKTHTETQEEICELRPAYITLPLFVCCKKFSAIVDTGCNFTKIGTDIANIAMTHGCVLMNKIFVFRDMQKNVRVINIPCGERMNRLKIIECIVDATVPATGIILGSKGLQTVGYKLTIGKTFTTHGESLNTKETELVVEFSKPIFEESIAISLTRAEFEGMDSWKR